MTRRRLEPEERKIWQKVARTVTPRRAGSAKAIPTRDEFADMLRLPPERPQSTQGAAQVLERNQDKKTRRGRVNIDTKIDLHDMTQEQARKALRAAIIRASNRQHKCVLVVTGKGVRLDGVLRRNFPSWIEAAEIRPLIASYAQAHIRHGGNGAWYVFLKS